MKVALAQRLLTEFIGTGFLCLTVTLSVGQSMPLRAVGIGAVLTSMVYMGGPLSGAHYNPAVTLAVWVRAGLPGIDALLYALTQLAAGAAFGGLAFVWEPQMPHALGYPARGSGVSWGAALACEIVLTLMLAHTVLHTATAEEADGKQYFGLAIGFAVLSGAISVGGISGGCFNPAVSMLCLVNGQYDDLWIYWLGPLVGGLLAGGVFNAIVRMRAKNECILLSSCAVEFVGTFMLCFTVATAAASSNSHGYIGGGPVGSGHGGSVSDPLASLSIGAALVSMVYAGGYGASFNPAVSIGCFFRRLSCRGFKEELRPESLLLCSHVVTQAVAVFGAGYAARASVPGTIGYPYPEPGVSVAAAFLAELLATFGLVLTVLNVATAKATSENSYFGLAIGLLGPAALSASVH